jgi:AraC-like DNA-binding protein
MKININQNDKRIITNEELYDLMVSSIADLRKSTLDGFDRVFEVIDENKLELKQDISDLRTELKQDISDLRTEFKQDISDLRTELKQDINDLRIELKGDILDLRKEMNQRFTSVDGRFSGLENNVAYKHQLSSKFA